MHPLFHEQIAKQRMEELQREAAAMQRMSSANSDLNKLQTRLNTTTRLVGLVALGLGSLIGGFLDSRFGLVPIVLMSSIILVVVSFPILMRSVSVLRTLSPRGRPQG